VFDDDGDRESDERGRSEVRRWTSAEGHGDDVQAPSLEESFLGDTSNISEEESQRIATQTRAAVVSLYLI
jgi:hypothetical protein